MDRLKNSWNLLKCAVRVMARQPKLLLFPFVNLLMLLVILAFFLVPLAAWNTGHHFLGSEHWSALTKHVIPAEDATFSPYLLNGLAYALVAMVYFTSVFLGTFSSVAFYNEILHALNGQAVSILGGFRFALIRVKAILMWSLLAGSVGLVIKALEERFGVIGRWVLRLLGITWNIAALFVIPVIIRENRHANPIQFLKDSAGILKKTWGEALVGYVGLRLVSIPLIVAYIVIVVLVAALAGWMLSAAGIAWSILVFIGAFLIIGVGVTLLTVVFQVAEQVYRAALFIYATEGVAPGPFDKEQMEMAWKVRAGRAG